MSIEITKQAADPAYEESEKLFFEAMKHVTTLNTGSILFIVTVWEKLLRNPHWRALIAVSLLSFGFSTLCSVSSMFQSANNVKWRGKMEKMDRLIRNGVHCASLGGFLLGIIGLVVFALKNLLA